MTPVTLVILDGWGVAPLSESNAIERAKTPHFSDFLQRYPSCALEASGEAVGLPYGEMGNSEVGHLTIGLGRIYYQPLPRITHAILTKTFFENDVLTQTLNTVSTQGTRLHIIGLVSNGGVHSTLDHLFALLDMARAKGIHRVFVHAILDGRDAPFNSGMNFIERLEERLTLFAHGTIASVTGRFWAMDRDNHWERTQAAFEAMTHGNATNQYRSARVALQQYYNSALYDEMIPATAILDEDGTPEGIIEANDAIVFFNFRPDRIRQLARALGSHEFSEFDRGTYQPPTIVSFTEYDPSLAALVAFPNEPTDHTLSEVVSTAGFPQLHIAETEKYAHVTYFINGYQEEPFPLEERRMLPSQRVSSYQEIPAMSALEIQKAALEYWGTFGMPPLTIINFANADMLGHTGDFAATRTSIEVLDGILGVLQERALQANGVLVITADHGNAEEMIDHGTQRIKTSHTANPVPFLLIGAQWEGHGSSQALCARRPLGGLSDVAPTILSILGLPIPAEMTGTNLVPLLVSESTPTV